jgi:hypothetical protein
VENQGGFSGKLALFAAFLAGSAVDATPTDDFRVQRSQVGKLSVGMLVSDVWKFYPRGMIKGGFMYPEGIPIPVIEIRLSRSQKEPSLEVGLAETKDHIHTIAKGINVLDRRFKTATGIGPGSTIALLRRVVHGLTIETFEQDTRRI